mmetsp:Transcript_27864/g.71153  ORF Transcript_27864/g.71153 Transcript_27864/m.71153 type:complete len:345 (-) Transcript_27864:123-1157(-)
MAEQRSSGSCTEPSSASAAARLECWQGALPAVFTLAPDEVCGVHAPRQFHKCLPRQSLLPLVCNVVRDHFAPFAPPLGGELWFEYNGTPLRWQLPIGVLFDLLVGEEALCTESLPWRITVHFASFPSGVLLKATVKEAEAVLLNSLKESCYLRCGSALPAMSLSPADQQKLATALISAEKTAFVDGYLPIASAIENATNAHLDGQPVRAVPLRVFTSPTSWRQLPLPLCQSDGTATTLGMALAILLPDHFAVAAVVPAASDPRGGASSEATGSGEDIAEVDVADGSRTRPRGDDGSGQRLPVLIQGISIPLDVTLSFLTSSCSHPDGWLYACVRMPVPCGGTAS